MAGRRRSRRKEQAAPGWVWGLFGLSIGLAVALFVFLQSGGLRPSPATREAAVEQGAATPPVSEPAPRTQPTPAQEAPEGSDSNEAQLGFYEELESFEVLVPESERPAEDSTQLASEYTIQAGSFRTNAEADSRRATLALLAIDSEIVPAIVQNDIWYRVIIGPMSDIREIDEIRRRLRQERIDTLPPRSVSD